MHFGTTQRLKFWSQKVKGQGHSMTKFAKNAICGVCFCDISDVHQRISSKHFITSPSCDKGELIMFWGQWSKVKVMGGGIQSSLLFVRF